eukprot:4703841-Pyramimonas_sp.AAC.1
MRALRACAGGRKAVVPDKANAASLRAHWARVHWTRGMQFSVGLAESAQCLRCGRPEDTPGHRFYGCAPLLTPAN